MNGIIHKTRVTLIRLGKVLPFVLCFIVFISYTESLFDLLLSNFITWNNVVIPQKPISWFIGHYFEYNLQMLVVLVTLWTLNHEKVLDAKNTLNN